MRSKILASVLFLTMLAPLNAISQKPNDIVLVIFGLGIDSCGRYVAEYGKNGATKEYYISWIQGYLTGKTVIPVPGREWDTEALGLWVYNFCTKNPTLNIHRATVQLLWHLQPNN